MCIAEGTRLTITTSTTLLVIDNVHLLYIVFYSFVLLCYLLRLIIILIQFSTYFCDSVTAKWTTCLHILKLLISHMLQFVCLFVWFFLLDLAESLASLPGQCCSSVSRTHRSLDNTPLL